MLSDWISKFVSSLLSFWIDKQFNELLIMLSHFFFFLYELSHTWFFLLLVFNLHKAPSTILNMESRSSLQKPLAVFAILLSLCLVLHSAQANNKVLIMKPRISDATTCVTLVAWYCMVLHDIAWYCMVLHGVAWCCMAKHKWLAK